ncbi:unnamed protein product, partial [Porites lobata]
QPTSQSFAFGKIGEVQGETTETVVTVSGRERGRKEGSNVTTATKKTRTILILCFDTDVFNRLTFTGEAEREISVKDIRGFLKESFVNEKII